MLLLHVSDIHFRVPDCENPDLDPARSYRTRMLRDVRERIQTLGPVEAILVSGDIAFRGDPAEYKAAYAWLEELAEACECSLERVFVVPGNHDVDRRVIKSSPSTRNAQLAVRQAPAHQRERELRTQFTDLNTGRALLAPLAAYNDFAKLFNCQVFPPERLYWSQELSLLKGVRLRIYGLTSTLLFGAEDQDDSQGSLYLSPLQTVLDPVQDVVNLVLCHHPPDWFLDQEEVQDAVCGRAAIHLFGHKHRQRVIQDPNYICFAAAAANPDRYETQWQPGYNLIRVEVAGSGQERALNIQAHLLEWQVSPERYRAVLTRNGEDVVRHRIAIPSRTNAIVTGPDSDENETTAQNIPALEAETDVEAAMSQESTRNLVFRFWNLTISQRREVAQRLGLIDEADLSFPEPERYGRALLRAGERGILEQLAHEVAEMEEH